ncbi:hypothetical protein Leryth_019776 [Lithospermum erythrorhizon]|nr:hypothetical protein Leryth_019776 [Lithospermum erythrorhizon]
MPFQQKVQPIDAQAFDDAVSKTTSSRSRLKRLFDRPFTNVLRSSSSSAAADKSLIPCSSKEEKSLLADASKIVEKNKACKRKEDLVKIVIESLLTLNYDAALCKSKWEKSSSIPAGEYEYIDVIIDNERIIIDVDFRSEFEIARSTGSYKAILQLLPIIFVGKSNRLSQIIAIVAESVKHSLKKKGMHVAPWRKSEYILSKWLGIFKRTCPPNDDVDEGNNCNGGVVVEGEKEGVVASGDDDGCVYEGGESDLIFKDKTTSFVVNNAVIAPSEEVSGDKMTSFVANSDVIAPSEEVFGDKMASFVMNSNVIASSGEVSGEGEKLDFSVKVPWQPPLVKLHNNNAIVFFLRKLYKR